MHIGERLVDRLIGYGVRYVFGCPGGQTLALYNGIARRPDEIGHILMRDERSAVYAADAYARASGQVGVCDATVGPGASNLVSGLIEAAACSTPLVAIVGDIPRNWEHHRRLAGANQAFDQRGFLESTVKWYGRVGTPESFEEILAACFRIATAGRPGPVVLEMPVDVFNAEAPDSKFPADPALGSFPRLRPGADPEAIERAAALIASSNKPMIVAGGGALRAGAGPAIVALAEKLGAPIATTMSGKGLVAETHPLAVGSSGRMGMPLANTLLRASDCAIFIGCKTGQATTLGWTVRDLNSPTVQIDVDAGEIGRNFHNTIGIFADARLGTEALRSALAGRTVAAAWDSSELERGSQAWWDGPITYREPPEPGVLMPQDIVRLMRNHATDDDVIVMDASLSTGWVNSRWQITKSGIQVFSPRGMGGLGWGLPGAVGVAVARRDRQGKVILLAGDGGWGYSLGEVETAARIGLPIVTVILNNDSLAWIYHDSLHRYPNEIVSDRFSSVRYSDSAAPLGAKTAWVDTLEEFDRMFAAAMADPARGPWVIEARTSQEETPLLPSSGGY
jgi:acetolactate synthase I/II/III large subunit